MATLTDEDESIGCSDDARVSKSALRIKVCDEARVDHVSHLRQSVSGTEVMATKRMGLDHIICWL